MPANGFWLGPTVLHLENKTGERMKGDSPFSKNVGSIFHWARWINTRPQEGVWAVSGQWQFIPTAGIVKIEGTEDSTGPAQISSTWHDTFLHRDEKTEGGYGAETRQRLSSRWTWKTKQLDLNIKSWKLTHAQSADMETSLYVFMVQFWLMYICVSIYTRTNTGMLAASFHLLLGGKRENWLMGHMLFQAEWSCRGTAGIQ